MPNDTTIAEGLSLAPWHRQSVDAVVPGADAPGALSAFFARPAIIVATATALYLVGLVVLFVSFRHFPNYAYNWEQYSTWDLFQFLDGSRPLSDTFAVNDGLMTNSGVLPVMTLPDLGVMHVFGVSFAALRVPMALVSALAVPLAYLLGRSLAGTGVGVLGALLVAWSPAFLVYGKTGTVVGSSVSFALLTAIALLHVVRSEHVHTGGRILTLTALNVMLVADAWAYSPIRFLWPIAIGLLLAEIVFQRDNRIWLLISLVCTIAVLPVYLTLMQHAGRINRFGGSWNPVQAVRNYYNGGGEQLVSLHDRAGALQSFVHQPPDENSGGLEWTLVHRNLISLRDLLLDRATTPAIRDFWNPHGQLIEQLLVPFGVIGLVLILLQALRSTECRFLLACVFGLTLPLLLTSQVHLGRLVFASPFLLLIAAIGIIWVSQVLIHWLPDTILHLFTEGRRAATGRLSTFRVVIRAALAGVLVVGVAWQAWQADAAGPTSSQSATPEVVAAVRTLQNQGVRSVAIVGGVPSDHAVEKLDMATYRMLLNDQARFVDVADGMPQPADANSGRFTVYSGGLAGATPSMLARLPGSGCNVAWVVRAGQADRFTPTIATLNRTCPAPPLVVQLTG